MCRPVRTLKEAQANSASSTCLWFDSGVIQRKSVSLMGDKSKTRNLNTETGPPQCTRSFSHKALEVCQWWVGKNLGESVRGRCCRTDHYYGSECINWPVSCFWSLPHLVHLCWSLKFTQIYVQQQSHTDSEVSGDARTPAGHAVTLITAIMKQEWGQNWRIQTEEFCPSE